MRAIALLLWKDAVAEARGPERLPTLVLFASGVLVTLHFSLPATSEARARVAAGFLWAAVLFAAMLELRRSFETERASGVLDALRAAPLDPTVILLSRIASGLAVLGPLIVALVPLTALFFSGRAGGVPAAVGVTLLASVGVLAWGTLFAAVAAHSRSGEIVLPLLLFPLLVPQTIASVRLLGHYLAGTPLTSTATGFVLLVAFDVLSLGTSILLFDYALEE